LAAFATFIGRHCGAGWKDDGLAEGVLEEAAKMWKKQSNAPIVDGDGDVLKSVLKTIESCMSGGRIISGKALSRQGSFAFGQSAEGNSLQRPGLNTGVSFGVSNLDIANEDEEEEDVLKDPREWITIISAFDQPRMVYSTSKKHFDRQVDLNCGKGLNFNISTDQSPNLLCSPHHPTKQSYSVNDLMSSTSVFSAMNPSKRIPWPALLDQPIPPTAVSPTRSRPSPTCLAAQTAPIFSLASLPSFPLALLHCLI
jgi:hypothetical protein